MRTKPANAAVRGDYLVNDTRPTTTARRSAGVAADFVSAPESAELWTDPERPVKRLSRAEIARRWLFPCYGAQANARDAIRTAEHRAYLRNAARSED